MLKQRLITVLWALPLVTAVTWFGEPWFTLLVAICGLLAAREFYRMAAVTASPLTKLGLIWTLLFILSPHFEYSRTAHLLLTSALVLSLIWLVLRRRERAFASWTWTMAGILYIGWLLSQLVALRGLDAGRDWVFLTLFATFASDSAAYLVGGAWGKHYLAPAISPRKTWEGAIAGVVAAIIVSPILVLLSGLPLNTGQALLLGLAISILGQLGDLAESLLKRTSGVKESSQLIPGHGGMLDRIDSVLFASAVVYYFVFFADWLNWL